MPVPLTQRLPNAKDSIWKGRLTNNLGPTTKNMATIHWECRSG